MIFSNKILSSRVFLSICVFQARKKRFQYLVENTSDFERVRSPSEATGQMHSFCPRLSIQVVDLQLPNRAEFPPNFDASSCGVRDFV